MSFLNKLFFWKHDDFDFDDVTEKEMQGMPPQDTFGEEKSHFTEPEEQPAASAFGPRTPAALTPASFSKSNTDLELINSKLDTIKALLNSIDQRLGIVERSGEEKKQKLW